MRAVLTLHKNRACKALGLRAKGGWSSHSPQASAVRTGGR